MHAVRVKQQLQRPTTKQVLLADCHVELWFILPLPGNWQAGQFTCIIRMLTLRVVIIGKIVRIIMEFLPYLNPTYSTHTSAV